MKNIFTKEWFRASGIRAIKTFAQNLVSVITTTATATSFEAVNWVYVVSSSVLAAILSILTSFKSLPELDGEKYSWIAAAGMRAIKTFCESAIAVIGTSLVLNDVNWILLLSTAGLSAVLSLFTSIAGLPEVEAKSDSTDTTTQK